MVHLIPSIYLANYLNAFEERLLRYPVQKRSYKKDKYLTKIHPSQKAVPLTQAELSSLAGAS